MVWGCEVEASGPIVPTNCGEIHVEDYDAPGESSHTSLFCFLQTQYPKDFVLL